MDIFICKIIMAEDFLIIFNCKPNCPDYTEVLFSEPN